MYEEALIAHLRLTDNREPFAWEWRERIRDILNRRGEFRPGALQDEYSMEILEIGARIPGSIPREVLEGVARSIPATSCAWVYHGSLPLFAQRIRGKGDNLVDQIVSRYPSENYRAYILYSEVSDLRLHGGGLRADSLMEVIYRMYRATPVGSSPNIWVNTERRLATYSSLPQFRFQSLDDPGVTLTNKAFEGKVLIVDFWNTTCLPCVRMMRSLHRYHELYHNKGFEILSVSIGDTAGEVRRFRSYRWPMPWANTVLPKEKWAETIKTFVASTPWVILADRKGIVLYADNTDVETYMDSSLAALLP